MSDKQPKIGLWDAVGITVQVAILSGLAGMMIENGLNILPDPPFSK